MRYRQPNNPNRQMLVRADHGQPGATREALFGSSIAPGLAVFSGLKELKLALQEAIALEHFTIPPYLCALYSLIDGASGANREAFQIIQSVAMEEMLHMILAANILNAIGGTPRIWSKDAKVPKAAQDPLPKYPSPLPHSAIGFPVNLLKFSKEAVNTFLRIERPAERTGETDPGTFWSIGEFYAAVREALNRLDREEKKHKKDGIFTGDKARQVTGEQYYGGGGTLQAIGSIDDANLAIDEIVGQGEGIDGTIEDADDTMFGENVELAHYFRFNEVFHERRYRRGDKPKDAPSGKALKIDWNAVYNMAPNPTMKSFAHLPQVQEKVKGFNRTYTKLLQTIERGCNGEPNLFLEATPLMREMANRAPELMQINVDNGETAGPSFEFVP